MTIFSRKINIGKILTFLLILCFSMPAFASGDNLTMLDLTGEIYGIAALVIFVFAYSLVIGEEYIHIKKSKPVLVAAGLIWILVGLAYVNAGPGYEHVAETAVRHNLLEFAELFLFLLAAMTFINAMEERGVFNALRAWLVSKGFTLKAIFWITGGLAFVISPVADNLTTALLMSAVVMAVGAGNAKFIGISCINIVVAANAGGAFSPFGDITTLMVWQKGIVHFWDFFHLVLPSVVNWLVPAVIMSMAIPNGSPEPMTEKAIVKRGGYQIVGLFLFTIAMAVSFHNFLHLPPVLGMMTGLGILKLYSNYLNRTASISQIDTIMSDDDDAMKDAALSKHEHHPGHQQSATAEKYDIFSILARAEWDTLMFFYGVILCVGGLGTIGYLSMISHAMYEGAGVFGTGITGANVIVGILSAIVDNIPVMFAVLSMNPDMSLGQWLLVTLTAGVGGSLLSIGSAAGVALMGQARGVYTFFGHLKWTWAIALGYVASIWVHLYINADMMTTAIY